MPRPVHFDIAADDPERAVSFYQSAFGWTITKWDGPMEYWLVQTDDGSEAPGIDGGIAARGEDSQPITNTLDVASVDEYVAKVVDAGGSVVSPKGPVPGVGWLAMCADTEGNVFGLMEADSKAGIG